MNFRNPTDIQIGQSGAYAGQTWQVQGRVVLGVIEDGEIYYWHEFNLAATTGESATLVYEKTETGAEWRWFTEFTPEFPMTAEDAATKQVGDLLNLDGTDVRVSLRETSRIYFVEGEAPAGEVVGAEANYFNAKSGNEMLVVSWTGDIVEFYRGRTITHREVRDAFGLSPSPDLTAMRAGALSRYYLSENSPAMNSGVLSKILPVLLGFILVLLIIATLSPAHRRNGTGITRFPAPPARLSVGAAGTLAGVDYHITGHALMNIAEVNLQFGRHEFFLRNRQGDEALLISPFTPGDSRWLLFTPLNPYPAMTAPQAAAVKLGQLVTVNHLTVPADTLFSSTVQDANFDGIPEVLTGETDYGFAGQNDSTYLLVRWNAVTISYWRGRLLSTRSVLNALGPAPRN